LGLATCTAGASECCEYGIDYVLDRIERVDIPKLCEWCILVSNAWLLKRLLTGIETSKELFDRVLKYWGENGPDTRKSMTVWQAIRVSADAVGYTIGKKYTDIAKTVMNVKHW
jgi:hypothetical protein